LTECFFVSDLHGRIDRYQKLFKAVAHDKPDLLLLGGDLLPTALSSLNSLDVKHQDFVNGFLVSEFGKLRERMGDSYPHVLLILGNDDGRVVESSVLEAATTGIWTYVHNRKVSVGQFSIYGYAFVPPTPFLLKDWERYDVSRYVDPGCISPEEGFMTVPMTEQERRYSTIQEDLEKLADSDDMRNAVFLVHTPPYHTNLDRAALDGRMVDHVPLDVYIGSIALQRFIERRQPLLTLHGHVHESASLTGSWRDQSGRTLMFTAAHDGPELALIRFSLENPGNAGRELL
jgi:Icc-related predicted phosphoesterase